MVTLMYTMDAMVKPKKQDMIKKVLNYVEENGHNIDSDLRELLAGVLLQNLTPKKSKVKNVKNKDDLFSLIDEKVFIKDGVIFNYTNYQVLYGYGEFKVADGCYNLNDGNKLEDEYNAFILDKYVGKENELDFKPLNGAMTKTIIKTDKYKVIGKFDNDIAVDMDLIKDFIEIMDDVKVSANGLINEPIVLEGVYPNTTSKFYLVTMGLTI